MNSNFKPDNDYNTDNVNNASSKRSNKRLVSGKQIPDEYLDWAFQQSPTIFKLFMECWRSDGYGNKSKNGEYQFKVLTTSLKGDNFRKTRKVLEDVGYFKFDKVTRHGEVIWRVWNCRGLISGDWKLGTNSDIYDESYITNCSMNVTPRTENPPTRTENPPTRTENPPKSAESFTQQELEIFQGISNRISNYKEKEIKNKQKESSDQVASLNATQPSDNLTEEEKVVRVVTMRVIENTRIVVPVRFVDRFDKEVEAFKEFLRNQPEPIDEQGFRELANKEYEFLKGLFDQYQAGLDYSLVAV